MANDLGSSTFQVFVELVNVLSWPIIAGLVLRYLGGPLASILREAGSGNLKVGHEGIEIEWRERQIRSAIALAAAQLQRSNGPHLEKVNGAESLTADPAENTVLDIAEVVSQTVLPRTYRKVRGASALWVDDNPENNRIARATLQQMGIRFTLAEDTENALKKAENREFDVIISDFKRAEDPQAGYSLLNKLQNAGIETPYIIYTGSASKAQEADAKKKGAFGEADKPWKLFSLVIKAIGQDKESE